MKKSIAYLPKRKQEDLIFLVREINKRLPQAELVILYGSYATGKYVEYDERVEFGVPTSFMSDYDILVVTQGIANRKAETVLDNIDDLYYKDPETQTPVQFITEDIKTLNRQLEEGRYFYTQLKQEGIILYDSGKLKLTRRRKLNFKEIQQQAQEYFNEKFDRAIEFLEQTKFAYGRNKYVMASFQLHQAAENFYYAIRLVFTLRSNKQHNLSKLSSSVKKHSEELVKVFPRNTEEEKRLFNLLKNAYVEARYNPDFLVTQQDIDILLPKVELLRTITERICKEKIKEYGEM
ncbi:HEPN domain-containing protein [Apibacter raozihei]|uniref:HEPN domain-containing protein n=1 Tax=Apibacter raozihei TaxID=2500547 RepID=UPI000FE36D06|nr:HEPN domain-containing protein [Apibacter raozihei]